MSLHTQRQLLSTVFEPIESWCSEEEGGLYLVSVREMKKSSNEWEGRWRKHLCCVCSVSRISVFVWILVLWLSALLITDDGGEDMKNKSGWIQVQNTTRTNCRSELTLYLCSGVEETQQAVKSSNHSLIISTQLHKWIYCGIWMQWIAGSEKLKSFTHYINTAAQWTHDIVGFISSVVCCPNVI